MKPDPMSRFHAALALAKEESPPQVDVTQCVLESLSQPAPRRAWAVEPEFFCVGLASGIAACAALIVFWFGASDATPLAFVQPFLTGFQ